MQPLPPCRFLLPLHPKPLRRDFQTPLERSAEGKAGRRLAGCQLCKSIKFLPHKMRDAFDPLRKRLSKAE